MSAYATIDQLATFLDTDPPADATRLLDRATEIIRYLTGSAVEIPADPEAIPAGVTETDTERKQIACRNATMAVVEEYVWQGTDNPKEARGVVKSESIGKFSTTFDTGQSMMTAGALPSRARMFLDEAGLLYAGAYLSAGVPASTSTW